MHASCVHIARAACAIVGASGSGKSTTASALAARGHKVLSDDITAVRLRHGVFEALPGYPRTCVWPESAPAFFASPETLPRISEGWDKRYVALDSVGAFHSKPEPIRAAYVLVAREPGPGAPRMRELSPREALLTLLGHSYAGSRLDRDSRRSEFEQLNSFVRVVRVLETAPRAGLESVGDLCSIIERDLATIRTAG